MTSSRGRGRPKGTSDSRQKILDAAALEFGERGYDGATVRSIARRAGVDAALVHHYFGTKAELFTEAADVPLRPDLIVPKVLAGPQEQVGERLVREVLELVDDEDVRPRAVALLRTAIGGESGESTFVQFLRDEVLPQVASLLDAPDAELRAELVASQIMGLLVARYVLRLPPLSETLIDDLVPIIGPTIQRYLFEE